MFPPAAAAFLIFAATAAAEVVWENPSQEFHRAPADGSVEARFTFKNAGELPVSIQRVTPSCGCTVAKVDKQLIEPGATGEIKAIFTFGGRRGLQKKTITVTTSDGIQKSLDLAVTIEEALVLSPALLFWRIGEAPTPKTISLKRGSAGPVHIRSVKPMSSEIDAKLSSPDEGQSSEITVAPNGTAQRLASTILVETDYPEDAPKTYTVYVRVK